MDNNKLVSVIVPVFNVCSYLPEAIDSVINQSYRNLEIIIIDDGSTDGSGLHCDKYAKMDKRIRVIHQDNQGLSSARNLGLDIMNGDAVAFLDSDDAYHTEYIKSMVESMSLTDADVVICKYQNINTLKELKPDGTEKILPTIAPGIYDRISILHAFANGVVDHSAWNKLYNRDLWKSIRYPVGHMYEDIATTYKLFDICTKASVVDTPLYFRRIHSRSITSTLSADYFSDEILARLEFETYIEANSPSIFSIYHVKRWQRARLARMINFYVLYSVHVEEQLFCNNLRKQIIELGEQIGLDGLWPETVKRYNIIKTRVPNYEPCFVNNL